MPDYNYHYEIPEANVEAKRVRRVPIVLFIFCPVVFAVAFGGAEGRKLHTNCISNCIEGIAMYSSRER